MRNIRSRFIQVDEMHGFVQVRQKNLNPGRHDEATMGEQHVFVAMDSETKLIRSFLVGKRNAANCYWLMKDLESRLADRVQLTTDGFKPYVDAVDGTFGSNVDYAMLVKVCKGDEENRERYSPSEIVEAIKPVFDTALDWVRYAPNCWILWTTTDIDGWYRRIKPHLGASDQVLTCEVNLANRQGWVKPVIWNWITRPR